MADIAHTKTDQKLEEMEKRLSAIYSRAEKEIQKTADEYFSRFAKQDEAKRKLLEQGKITEEEYTRWLKGKVMYGKRFSEVREQCAKQLLNVNQTAVAYTPGQMRVDPLDGCLYRVNGGQGHTSQQGWNPSLVPALWTKVADPTDEWQKWAHPIGAHDAYNAGDKVSHNGKTWTSDLDNNVWEPGVYG